MLSTTDKIASTLLGKKVESCEIYNPSFLVAVPRIENRTQYYIDMNNLPFEGIDVWHAYEFSVLTENNIPITRVIKLKYNCNNEFLIESKSLKLYLNSYNMSQIGKNTKECLEICKSQIIKDLSEKLQTNVEVNFLDKTSTKTEIYNEFVNLESFIDEKKLKITHFKEAPELIKYEELEDAHEYFLHFDSLRSNCRVTHQPDFGDAFIYYKSRKHIDETSLFSYLTSFRSEYHFHEECCEMIFKRIFDLLNKDDEIFVSTLYTRRGGIDICPSRWSKNCKYRGFVDLVDLNKLARNGIKQ